LRRLGYRILVRNFQCPQGELDLIALDQKCIVFVEVRSTGKEEVDRPAQSVDTAKQRRLTNLALRFLQKHRLLGQAVRFDVIAVAWPDGRREPTIAHFPNAFEAIGRFQMFQ
jgi:putative endonuclease